MMFGRFFACFLVLLADHDGGEIGLSLSLSRSVPTYLCILLSGDINFVRSKMLECYTAAGEKVWGCSLCSYSHKGGLSFLQGFKTNIFYLKKKLFLKGQGQEIRMA
jgi:hypothetical protein